ncbi:putative S-adenosylmethionine-dependent methyltransferase [compost metagenome]
MKQANIFYAGCGDVRLELMDGKSIICPIVDAGQHLQGYEYIVCPEQLQYFTTMEADTLFIRLFDELPVNALLEVSVLDLDYIFYIWKSAEWNESTLRNPDSDARRAFTSIFGAQSDGNPTAMNYSRSYIDCHKSGYNSKRLDFLMTRAGFVDISIDTDERHILHARARKSMSRCERQIAPDIQNIRRDHLNRYQFAVKTLLPEAPKFILDLACGIGYGSRLLAESLQGNVTAVDIDAEAVAYAKQYYAHPNVDYVCADARELQLAPESLDAVVSFETVEHIDFDTILFTKFYNLLRPGGLLIFSTPNQDVMPFDKSRFPFHLKHYHVSELQGLMQQIGFTIHSLYNQQDINLPDIQAGADGAFIIVVAEKS